jgi:hypothetical protein
MAIPIPNRTPVNSGDAQFLITLGARTTEAGH